MALLWVLSDRPSVPLPEVGLAHVDKLVHAGAYAILAGFWWVACLRLGLPAFDAACVAFFAAVAFGLVDELHQAQVPGRSADRLDLVADAVGAALAAGVAQFWGRFGPPRPAAARYSERPRHRA
jgi:VanZ family protein